MITALIPLHMGALHAYEQWLVAGIAFGPFLILGLVIAIRRRQDLAEETEQAATGTDGSVDALADRAGGDEAP